MGWILAVLWLLLVFLLILIFPAWRHHPQRETLRGAFVAHRGLHGDDRPENSLSAFQAAVRAGYMIECDLHLTADGEVVVFHDDTLTRMCGMDGRVEEQTLDTLKSLRLKNSNECIPTLREMLDVVDGRVPLLIEFKLCSNNAAPLCEAAENILKDYRGVYIIQSFYPTVLHWYKTHRPQVCRGQLAESFLKDSFVRKLAGCLLFNVISRPDFVSYSHYGTWHPCFRLCTLLGAQPIGWTFRSQQDIENHRKDFEGFIFEGFIPQ